MIAIFAAKFAQFSNITGNALANWNFSLSTNPADNG